MVRIIVMKLLELGSGEITLEEFENYLALKETPKKIVPAYPQGLYLSRIAYSFLDTPPRTEFSTIFQNKVDNTWLTI